MTPKEYLKELDINIDNITDEDAIQMIIDSHRRQRTIIQDSINNRKINDFKIARQYLQSLEP